MHPVDPVGSDPLPIPIIHINRRLLPGTNSAPPSTYVSRRYRNAFVHDLLTPDPPPPCTPPTQVGLTNYINALWAQASECFRRCDAMMAPVGGTYVQHHRLDMMHTSAD